jgi:LL-diaminopimelate aminotransferase
MAGFRMGMLVGNPTLVDAVGRVKSNIDSGIFRPIQYAAIEALNLPVSWIEQRNEVYKRRRDILIEGCNAVGMHARAPKAGLYVWAHVPERFTSKEFANWLFDKAGVHLTAGSSFGQAGEGYVRIAITEPEERIQIAIERIKTALQS